MPQSGPAVIGGIRSLGAISKVNGPALLPQSDSKSNTEDWKMQKAKRSAKMPRVRGGKASWKEMNMFQALQEDDESMCCQVCMPETPQSRKIGSTGMPMTVRDQPERPGRVPADPSPLGITVAMGQEGKVSKKHSI